MKFNRQFEEHFELKVKCPNCEEEREISVHLESYISWRQGKVSVQEAFPELSPDDREGLLTGLCPTCWDKITKL